MERASPGAPPSTQIDVLVVDDSPLMQRIITHLIESDLRIRVIGTASDGVEAVQKVAALRPDVVTLDIEMPLLDGLGALKAIMERTPTPVIMLSALDEADTVMKALQLGAVDFVSKPSGTVSIDLYKVRDEIIGKIKVATFTRPEGFLTRRNGRQQTTGPLDSLPPATTWIGAMPWYAAIGASTGGPRAIEQLMRALPPDLPVSILIVQHMPAGFTRSFAGRLDRASRLAVCEAEDGMPVEQGKAYVAPGGLHMVLARRDGRATIHLDASPSVNSVRPSVDVLMRSVAEIGGTHSLGVLLTGMGSDGANGLAEIKAAGGFTIAQDRETSTIYGMPRVAIQRGVVDAVLPLSAIPQALMKVLQSHPAGEVRRVEEEQRHGPE